MGSNLTFEYFYRDENNKDNDTILEIGDVIKMGSNGNEYEKIFHSYCPKTGYIGLTSKGKSGSGGMPVEMFNRLFIGKTGKKSASVVNEHKEWIKHNKMTLLKELEVDGVFGLYVFFWVMMIVSLVCRGCFLLPFITFVIFTVKKEKALDNSGYDRSGNTEYSAKYLENLRLIKYEKAEDGLITVVDNYQATTSTTIEIYDVYKYCNESVKIGDKVNKLSASNQYYIKDVANC